MHRQRLVAGAISILCSLSAGCFGATRVPIRTITVSGEEKQAGVDLEFINPGETNRADVLGRLGWVDTGVQSQRIFVGRWVSSAWYVALGQSGGRNWTAKNLLVEFDERGLVTRHRVVSDGSLAEELAAWAARAQERPLELAPPNAIPVKHIHTWLGANPSAILILGEQFLEFKESGDATHDFRLSPGKVARLTSTTMATGSGIPDPKTTCLTFHFSEKISVGKKLNVSVDVPTMMILVPYIVRYRAATR